MNPTEPEFIKALVKGRNLKVRLLLVCLFVYCPGTHVIDQAGCELTQRSVCLCLSSAGIKSVHQRCPAKAASEEAPLASPIPACSPSLYFSLIFNEVSLQVLVEA